MLAEHVLVEALAGADAEPEPALAASTDDVAAAWATIAGWMRSMGHVTAVVTSRPVVAAMPPMTVHTKGDSPCSSIHGWKWSEMLTRLEAGPLGHLRLLDEGSGPVLLRGQEVAEGRHWVLLEVGDRGPLTPCPARRHRSMAIASG